MKNRDIFYFNSKSKKLHYHIHITTYEGVPWYKSHVKCAVTVDFDHFELKINNGVIGLLLIVALSGLVIPTTYILMTRENIIFNLSYFVLSVLFLSWVGYLLKNKKKILAKLAK